MKLALSGTLAAALAVGAAGIEPVAFGASSPRYRLTPLAGLPGAVSSHGLALNDRGDVVGDSNGELSEDGYPLAVIWPDGGAPIFLGGIGQTIAGAFDVDERGIVAGVADHLPGVGDEFGVAFAWKDGEYRGLPHLLGIGFPWSNPLGIDARGRIVGVSSDRPVLWQRGRVVGLPMLGGSRGAALDITASGVIVGWANRSDGISAAAMWVRGRPGDTPPAWNPYSVIDLGSLGGVFTGASALNARGEVVGWGYPTAPLSDPRALYWSEGEMTELEPLSDFSFALGIAEDGTIVGSSGGRAVLWTADGHTVIDLNEVTEGLDGWILSRAEDINEAGQITGSAAVGFERRAFRLEPVGAFRAPGK